MLKLRLCLGVALASFCVAGCGGPKGLTTYQLTGTVTYNGAPVPNGTITLSPDHAKGNNGPGAAAGIKNGKFVTSPGKGHIGGAYVLDITGYDGVPVQGTEGMNNDGTELFPPYRMEVDLPDGDKDLSIEVPADEAAKQPGP